MIVNILVIIPHKKNWFTSLTALLSLDKVNQNPHNHHWVPKPRLSIYIFATSTSSFHCSFLTPIINWASRFTFCYSILLTLISDLALQWNPKHGQTSKQKSALSTSTPLLTLSCILHTCVNFTSLDPLALQRFLSLLKLYLDQNESSR